MAEPLEYASSCVIPTSWLALPLLAKREYNHNSTIYTFGLPDNKSLSLPVCACLLLKAPGKGRKDGGGKESSARRKSRYISPRLLEKMALVSRPVT